MKVTLKDIAQQAGVSVNTVSLALRGMPGVRRETCARIQQIASELGYAGVRETSESHNVGLVSTGARLRDSYFYMSFYQHILSETQKLGYDLMVFQGATCDVEQEQLRQKFESKSLAGIIILGDMEERIVKKVAACGIPVVATGTRYRGLQVPTVIEDNLLGAILAVDYLYERGYRKIGFLGQPLHSTGFYERYQGFLGEMFRRGLTVEPKWNLHDLDPQNVYHYQTLYDVLARMPELPEAFVCANDNLAMLAVRAISALGFSVPEDVALIGFDNSTMGKMACPSITSVDVRVRTQSKACVKCLMNVINGENIGSSRVLIPVTLAEGESVGDRRAPM